MLVPQVAVYGAGGQLGLGHREPKAQLLDLSVKHSA